MKLNPAHTIFDGNMFVQLRDLLDPITAPEGLAVLDMSIGEPQQPPTKLLTDSVERYNEQWQFYPRPSGSPRFTEAVENYIAQRWPEATGLADQSQIIAVPGTREPPHLLGHLVNGSKVNSAALVTNPFYHAWRAGALASGGEIIFLNSDANFNFLPDLQALDLETLNRASILFLCSPTNPQGSVMDLDYLVAALRLARAHDGVDSNGDPLANIVVLNSLSKRSGAAGLRAGFMVGDKQVIAQYLKLVGNGGSLVPTPLLSVAADLYEDERHVADIRAYYDANFALAQKHLGITPPQGGFFLWLKVADDVQFVKRLMSEQAIRALPGSFMGAVNSFGNPGSGYVRMALVHDLQRTDEALGRVATIYNSK